MNGPGGLEQGFTLAPLPQTDANGSLTVELALVGDLTATVNAAGNGLSLSRPDGSTALGYTGLVAYDAAGKSLPASLEVRAEGSHQELLIHVNDVGAKGPITIDPFIQEAELPVPGGANRFGLFVAISGGTIVVGGEGSSAYVFTEPSSGWSGNVTEMATLSLPNGDSLGSVAMSGDTVVALSGAAAYVFVEPSSGWENMTETATLTASNGGTLSMGLPSTATRWWLERLVRPTFSLSPSSGWGNATETAKLTPSDGAATNDSFGGAVAISNNNTVVVTAKQAIVGGNAFQGEAYVFVKPSSGWESMTETAKLTASDGAAGGEFGGLVAISNNTVVVTGSNAGFWAR